MGSRKYSDAERAIHYACALGRLSLTETNTLLRRAGFHEVPEGTWSWIVRGYILQFERNRRLLGDAILGVYKLGDLMRVGNDREAPERGE